MAGVKCVNPIMEQSTESARSDTDAPDMEDRQSMIGYYVDEITQRLVEYPYESVPQLLQFVAQWGPCATMEEVLHLFGGRRIFIRPCHRMNLIRGAVLRGDLESAPADLRRWIEMERPEMGPPYCDSQDWWAPHLDSAQTFWHNMQAMDEEIIRYPTLMECYTDEYFGETTDESWPMEKDGDENDGRNGNEDERQLPQTNANEEGQEDQSDDEEWRRPPPINTMGLEWFYE